MKFVFAPDSFKGSLTAYEVINILTDAAREVFPGCECIGIPMADGGEGTMSVIKDICHGKTVPVKVLDPLFNEIESHFVILNDDTALIEMAAASGLPLVPADSRDPELTTTFGTGQLIIAALDAGLRKFIIGVGGSATNDGGMGAACALGVRFYDQSGCELPCVGGSLINTASVDISNLHSAIKDSSFTVMCDITNPLLGDKGATYVFGPQKGASPDQLVRLESGMKNYARLLSELTGRNIADVPGAGAAGGLAAGLMAFTGAQLSSGISTVLSLSRFEEQIKDADCCITGEGRADSQSAHGKVLWGVGNICKKHNIPAIALAGCLGDGYEELYDCGINRIYTSMEDGMNVEYAMSHAEELLEKAAGRLFKGLKAGALSDISAAE